VETVYLFPNFLVSVVLNVFLYLETVNWEKASETIHDLKERRNS